MLEVAPAPQRSERLRNASNVLLLDNDEPLTYAEADKGWPDLLSKRRVIMRAV